MSSENHALFFYGTLLHPPILHRVIHGPHNPSFPTPSTSYIRTQPAILHSHRRHRVRGADYPAVVPAPSPSSDSSVRGTLATGLTAQDVRRLDIFEGDEYARRAVRVRILRARNGRDVSAQEALELSSEEGAGQKLVEDEQDEAAETYIWVAGRDRLEDDEWDFETFKREKMRFWVGDGAAGKEEYEVVDAAVAKDADGTGGRRLDGEISRVLEKDYEAVRNAA